MTATLIAQVGALVVLLIVSGFCSSSETVFFSLDPLKIRRINQERPGLGDRIHRLLGRPTRLLSTILILNTGVNFVASALSYRIAARFSPTHAEAISIAGITLLLLVFGEYGPKHFGLLFTRQMATAYCFLMPPLITLLAPLRWGLEKITRTFEHLFRPASGSLSNEEFATVVDISSQEGIIDAEEFSMIKAIIEMEKMRASDVMTPRVDLIGLDLEDDSATYPERVRKARRRYLLLYRGRLDEVEGFLDARRFLLDPAHGVEAARMPPYFVPESLPLNRLLAQFQRERRRMAVVVDEYGGTSGVITRGDILERVAGEVYHELSRPRPVFQEAGPGRWLVDAGYSLADINRRLDLNLVAEGADRLAGWAAYHAGHLLAANEVVEAQGCRVTVLQTDRNRMTLAQIERLTGEEPS